MPPDPPSKRRLRRLTLRHYRLENLSRFKALWMLDSLLTGRLILRLHEMYLTSRLADVVVDNSVRGENL